MGAPTTAIEEHWQVDQVRAAVDAADEIGGVDVMVNDAAIFAQHG